jgi:TonB family protein
MQKVPAAINPALLCGVAASLLLHGSLLGMRSGRQGPAVAWDSGHAAVELTLVPSVASLAHTPTQPDEPEQLHTTSPPVITEHPVPPANTSEFKKAPAASEPAIPATANAQKSDGSPELDKGIESPAAATSPCRPLYPRLSRRFGEEGVVVVSVEVDGTGRASDIHIVRSSGYDRLDRAAMAALEKACFTPAMHHGKPCASILTQTFRFRLNDD